MSPVEAAGASPVRGTEPSDRVPDSRSVQAIPSAADVAELVPMLRRVVGARMRQPADVEDLVQETITRVLAATDRIEPGMLEAYAIRTARNLVATRWRADARELSHQHRLLDLDVGDHPEDGLLAFEDRTAVAAALEHFSEEERALLLAHEVEGRSTAELGAARDSTAGAVAAQLHRLRARLRVEYLLAAAGLEPASERCRPVLLALSSRDGRRRRETDAEGHVLRCEVCHLVSGRLLDEIDDGEDVLRFPVGADADVVTARQGVRELAARAGFTRTEQTVVATAVSEVARNIVKFAGRGAVVLELIDGPRPGIRVTARDAGPGIPDLDEALRDGYSTYHGLGIGLPGARRLMDEFEIVTEPGVGTTVTMSKWQQRRQP
jgi:RNA polymerase sigma factor (sigma-70 family)